METMDKSSSTEAMEHREEVQQKETGQGPGKEPVLVAAPSPSHRPSLVPAAWKDTVRVIGLSECREAALSLAHAFAEDALSLYLVPREDSVRTARTARTLSTTSEEARWRLHVDIMTYIVAAVARNGIVTTVGPDYEGVALWVAPGQNVDGWWTALRSGLWRLRWQLSPEGRRRYFDELMPLLHRTKTQVMASVGEEKGREGRTEKNEASVDLPPFSESSTSSTSFSASASASHRRPACRGRNAVPADNSYYLLYLGTKPGARRCGYAQKLLTHMFAKADYEKCPIYLESSSAANTAYYRKFDFFHKKDIALIRGPTPVTLAIMVREPHASV